MRVSQILRLLTPVGILIIVIGSFTFFRGPPKLAHEELIFQYEQRIREFEESGLYERRNGTLVTLIRGDTKSVTKLIGTLQSIHDRFNHRYHYPIVVFYEEISEGDSVLLTNSFEWEVTLARVEFSIPSFIDMNKVPEAISHAGEPDRSYGIGYRHMTRFFGFLMYEHPALQGYDWYWRLDSHIDILCDIPYDLFAFMQRHGLKYGYNMIVREFPIFLEGLFEATQDYKADRNVEFQSGLDKFFGGNGKTYNTYHYWNNFEISSLALWRSSDFQDYLNYIDRLGGAYYKRWGDAITHTMAVSMFLKESEIHYFDDIGYQHNDRIHCPVSCSDPCEPVCLDSSGKQTNCILT
eukprot:Clim_evm25s197 gene=Clim_evmTU25s197